MWMHFVFEFLYRAREESSIRPNAVCPLRGARLQRLRFFFKELRTLGCKDHWHQILGVNHDGKFGHTEKMNQTCTIWKSTFYIVQISPGWYRSSSRNVWVLTCRTHELNRRTDELTEKFKASLLLKGDNNNSYTWAHSTSDSDALWCIDIHLACIQFQVKACFSKLLLSLKVDYTSPQKCTCTYHWGQRARPWTACSRSAASCSSRAVKPPATSLLHRRPPPSLRHDHSTTTRTRSTSWCWEQAKRTVTSGKRTVKLDKRIVTLGKRKVKSCKFTVTPSKRIVTP